MKDGYFEKYLPTHHFFAVFGIKKRPFQMERAFLFVILEWPSHCWIIC
jgi:hypothetical protein